MTLPLNQGTVNVLRGAVNFALFPGLNVTAAFLVKEGISIALEGNSGRLLPTMTGGVQSPLPYQMASVTLHLNRAGPLADLFKLQMELDSNLGDFNVIPDTAALSDYPIVQGIIESVQEVTFDGNTPGWVVKLQGIYYVNAVMWAST